MPTGTRRPVARLPAASEKERADARATGQDWFEGREVTAAEVRKAMNVEAALRRRREHDDEDDGRERDERFH